jgi:hypothetical protein
MDEAELRDMKERLEAFENGFNNLSNEFSRWTKEF